MLADGENTSDARLSGIAREVESLVAMGRLAGRVAHEINNPLASIQNAFMLVKDAIPESHPHYAYVGAIDREIRRMALVTRRLVEHYRPEQDRAVGVAVSVIVRDAVRSALESTGSDGERVRVQLMYHGEFCAPAGVLRHAVEHLLEAALRSGIDGSLLDLDVAERSGDLVIVVRCRGVLIKGENWQSAARMIDALGGTLTEASAIAGITVLTAVVSLFHDPARGS